MSGHPCPERLLLPEALSGRLDPSEEKRVMAHLQTCVACQDAAADIEVALVSLAVLRDGQADAPAPELVASASLRSVDPVDPVDTADPADPAAGAALASAEHDAVPVLASRRRPVRRMIFSAAAAVALLVGGMAVGHEILPPRERLHYGPALALAPPAGAADQGARGTVAVAAEGDALAVQLKASALPAGGWYECVWNSSGESRSAGSFRAVDGAVNVELRVAPPQESAGWDLQVLRHDATGTHVVLEGSAGYPT